MVKLWPKFQERDKGQEQDRNETVVKTHKNTVLKKDVVWEDMTYKKGVKHTLVVRMSGAQEERT